MYPLPLTFISDPACKVSELQSISSFPPLLVVLFQLGTVILAPLINFMFKLFKLCLILDCIIVGVVIVMVLLVSNKGE